MPKKLKPESEHEQSVRFKREAQKLIDAGEFDPAEAAKALDGLLASTGRVPIPQQNDRSSKP